MMEYQRHPPHTGTRDFSADHSPRTSTTSTEEESFPTSATLRSNRTQRAAIAQYMDGPLSNNIASSEDNDAGADQSESPRSFQGTARLPPSPLVTPPAPSQNYAKHNFTMDAVTLPAVQQQSPIESPTQLSPDCTAKRGVPHVYHDFSQVPEVSGFVRKKTGGVTQPFPEKLHEMLQAVEQDPEARSVVSWLPHGRAFLVHKPKAFARDIMPRYFRQTKLTSFQRQLNLYAFRRITQGPDGGAYYHELFLRGRPGLSRHMVRQKVKGTGYKQPSDVKSEPNFYAMDPLPSICDSPPNAPALAVSGPTLLGELDMNFKNENVEASNDFANYVATSPSVTAAQLLRGIATADLAVVPAAPFLGPPAVQWKNSTKTAKLAKRAEKYREDGDPSH